MTGFTRARVNPRGVVDLKLKDKWTLSAEVLIL